MYRCVLLILSLLILSLFCAAVYANEGSQGQGLIEIHTSIYGSLTKEPGIRKTCNALTAIRKACQGKTHCSLKADNTLCGDPDPTADKYLDVEYSCGFGHKVIRVNDGGVLTIKCP